MKKSGHDYKKDFSILNQMIHEKPLVFLDSSSSNQKPNCVIDAMSRYYHENHANIHRGVHQLSERATIAFENARKKIQKTIGAKEECEIIFTSGTTESLNLIAHSYGRAFFKPNDEVIISAMEHHSNIIPWQMLVKDAKIHLKIIPINDEGELDLDVYKTLFSERTKMVAITHASNVLGTLNPLKEIIQIAHQNQVSVAVDGAQAFPHLPIDVQELDCDFYTFSAHKAYGPTGVGVLYGKKALLEAMPPYQTGGGMIETVSFEKTTYARIPYKFEAGTPNIAGVIGFHAALDYLDQIGMDTIVRLEKDLLDYATWTLSAIPGLRWIGTAKNKIGALSFVLEGIHPHDIGTILDHEGVAVRVGHHCAMPLMERFRIPACVRASLGLYNTEEDIDALVAGIRVVQKLFSRVLSA